MNSVLKSKAGYLLAVAGDELIVININSNKLRILFPCVTLHHSGVVHNKLTIVDCQIK